MTYRPYYTLTDADVHQPVIRAFGRVWLVSGFLGSVLRSDVGKRVYLVGDIVQVENNEQRDQRMSTTAHVVDTTREVD